MSSPIGGTAHDDRVIVSVAPVAHVGSQLPPGIENPLTPEQVAEDAVRCANAGASMIHLHVRNRAGEQTHDITEYSRTIDLIRERSDMVVQGSTGGLSTLSLAERCVSVTEPRTEIASLNMGSTNVGETVYVNTVPDIRYWIGEMRRFGVVPELEVFTIGMLATIDQLVAEGELDAPLRYSLALGFAGALPADPRYVAYVSSLLPVGAHWGVIHDGIQDLQLLATALAFGARTVRVGFEDGASVGPPRPAQSNVEQVEWLVRLIRILGLEPASPTEARAILAIPAR